MIPYEFRIVNVIRFALTTMHESKGLEFDDVFMISMKTPNIPPEKTELLRFMLVYNTYMYKILFIYGARIIILIK